MQIEMDADGMRVDLLEETLDRLEREGRRPKFIYTVPTFQNPAGVTMSLSRAAAPGRDRARARAAGARGQPVRAAALRGRALPPLYALDGGDYVIYLGTFSKILSPGIRLGWVVAPPPVLAKINLGKQAADLCTSSLSQLFVHAYLSGALARLRHSLTDIYRQRRDAMLDALAEFFPREAEWTRPGGGLFIWATLPDFIDTTDLLARALRENVAFVPGAAAYLDGRGRSSMRLNFSGADEESIGEGVRRIGKVVNEQVELFGRSPASASAGPSPQRAEVVDAEPAQRASRCAAHERERRASALTPAVAVLKGGPRWSASLAALGRAGRGCARAARPRRRLDRRRRDLVERCARREPDVAFVALHGRGGEDGTVQELLEIVGMPYTGSGVLACMRSMDKVLTKHLLLEAGLPTPDFFAFSETAFNELGAGGGAARDRGAARVSVVVKPAARVGARDQVRRSAATSRRR